MIMGYFEAVFRVVVRMTLTLLAAYGLVILLEITDSTLKFFSFLVLSIFIGLVELLLII